jgi:4-hydroxyphenylacetate 3-monooxygenase
VLRTGKEHIERLRDGRIVYIGRGRVDDVTTHPAFRNAARTVPVQMPASVTVMHDPTLKKLFRGVLANSAVGGA